MPTMLKPSLTVAACLLGIACLDLQGCLRSDGAQPPPAAPATASTTAPATPSPAPVLAPQPPSGYDLVATEIFFGSSRPNGEEISGVEWTNFVNKELTTGFPGGFTVVDGCDWRKGHGGSLICEPCHVVTILHPAGSDADRAIDTIRNHYQSQFQLDSVPTISLPAIGVPSSGQ